MTVSELLARVDSRELSEWRAFYMLEPFGADAEYFGHALNAAHIINSRRKRRDYVKADDLMPKFGKPKEQTVDEMISIVQMYNAALGGEDQREK